MEESSFSEFSFQAHQTKVEWRGTRITEEYVYKLFWIENKRAVYLIKKLFKSVSVVTNYYSPHLCNPSNLPKSFNLMWFMIWAVCVAKVQI